MRAHRPTAGARLALGALIRPMRLGTAAVEAGTGAVEAGFWQWTHNG